MLSRKRLCDVSIDAESDSVLDIALCCFCREHDDGYGLERIIVPYSTQKFYAGHHWHIPVGNHQVVVLLFQFLQRNYAVRSLIYSV